MERSELLPLADRVVRAAYDSEIVRSEHVSGKDLMRLLALTEDQTKHAITYAAKRGWIEVIHTFGERLPVSLSLTPAGIRYVDTPFGDASIPQVPAPQTVYILNGNSRINYSSHDQSVNIVNTGVDDLFQRLEQAISTNVADHGVRTQMLASARELQAASPGPSRVTRYAQLLQIGAHFITVLTPFIPALGEFISQGQ